MKKKFYQYITNEMSRRKAIEENLNLRLRQQEAIAWFGEFAIGRHTLDELFDQCVRLIAQTLDVELCKLLELLPDGKGLLLRSGVGWKEGLVGHAIVGAGRDSQSGYTLLTEEPIIVTDLSQETRFNGPKLLLDHQVMSGMSVMILGREQPFGAIGAHTKKLKVFTRDDTRFLKSIANILASAIERFRTEEELRQSTDELAIILNGISEGVTAQERSGRLVYANQAAAHLLGYTNEQELLKAPLAEVMSKFEMYAENGEPFDPHKLPGRLVLQGMEKASDRIRFRIVETGEEHWSIADAQPVRDPSGQAVLAVNIFRDVTEMVRSQQWQELLAEAGKLFVSSLNYEDTLANVAQLAVTNLADWCTAHLVTDENEIFTLAVAHKEPSKVEMAREYNHKYPPSWDANSALARVLRTGKAEYYPEITDEMLVASARSPEHLTLARQLGFKSAMIVPLITRERTLGAITLIWAESGRRYTEEEVELVQELARRAAIAIDNARLYHEAQAINSDLEQRVALRTEELQISNQRLINENEERIKAESALRQSEAMLQNLFDSAPDATVLVDAEGHITRASRQVEIVFGYAKDELVGQSVNTLLPKRFRTRHSSFRADFFGRASTRPMGAGLELFARRKDGSELPVDIMLSPVQTQEGDFVIASIRDITAQKRLQSELSETHRRLFESIEAERLMLSQELHDGPIQDLYAISFNLEIIKDAVEAAQEAETMESTKDMLQTVIQTLRAMCGDLRPPTLNHLGLEKSIRSHLARIHDTHPNLLIHQNLMSDGQLLPERVRLAMFRVYQNSINNTIRHSKATQATVSFQIEDERAILEVQDNGRGFVVPDKWVELVRAGHFGLVGMMERIQAVGGHLEVISAPGKGTVVQVEVPYKMAEPVTPAG